MKKIIAVLIMLLPSVSAWADAYSVLLKKYVKSGERKGITANLVDYGAWSRDAMHQQAMRELETALSTLNGQSTQKQQMALWINAYNLLTIDLIIREKEYDSIRNLGNFIQNPWKKHKWRLNGKYYTLHEIEHEILRSMGDPRIHFAINCASLSCPDLRSEVYLPGRLDAQLEDQARKFLSDGTKGILAKDGTVKISRIFDWFSNDFNAVGSVEAYLTKMTGKRLNKRQYLDYNWKLNGYWE